MNRPPHRRLPLRTCREPAGSPWLQSGAAALLLLAMLIAGGGLLLLGLTQPGSGFEPEEDRARRLGRAREALQAYAVNYIDHYGPRGAGPGHLPCPDTDADTPAVGSPGAVTATGGPHDWRRDGPNPPCGHGPLAIGRLPRHIDLPGLRYGVHAESDQRFGYAVATGFINNPVNRIVNPASHGSLRVGARDDIIAVIFDPAMVWPPRSGPAALTPHRVGSRQAPSPGTTSSGDHSRSNGPDRARRYAVDPLPSLAAYLQSGDAGAIERLSAPDQSPARVSGQVVDQVSGQVSGQIPDQVRLVTISLHSLLQPMIARVALWLRERYAQMAERRCAAFLPTPAAGGRITAPPVGSGSARPADVCQPYQPACRLGNRLWWLVDNSAECSAATSGEVRAADLSAALLEAVPLPAHWFIRNRWLEHSRLVVADDCETLPLQACHFRVGTPQPGEPAIRIELLPLAAPE